jgi:hypothetical protein
MQIGMLKCVITLYEESQRAIADSPADKRITWTYIKTTLGHLIQKVVDCKFLVREGRCRRLDCAFADCFSVSSVCVISAIQVLLSLTSGTAFFCARVVFVGSEDARRADQGAL